MKRLHLLILFAILASLDLATLNAQSPYWDKGNGPFVTSNTSRCITSTLGGDLLAFDDAILMHRSTDDGVNWNDLEYTGLPSTQPFTILSASNGVLYSTSIAHGIYRSTDNGSSWTPIAPANQKIPNFFGLKLNSQDHIFAWAENSQLYRSTDGGSSWTKLPVPGVRRQNIISVLFTRTDKIILVKENGHIYSSITNGNNWQSVRIIKYRMKGASGIELAYNPAYDRLYAKLYLIPDVHPSIVESSDQGRTWKKIILDTSGGAPLFSPDTVSSFFFNTSGNVFLSGPASTLKLTLTSGKYVVTVLPPPPAYVVSKFISHQGTLIFGTFGGGVIRSTNDGLSWQFSNMHLGATIFSVKVGSTGDIFTTDGAYNLYRSSDNGAAWTRISTIPYPDSNFRYSNAFKYFVSPNGHIFVTTLDRVSFKSTDNGATWARLTNLPQWSTLVGMDEQGHLFSHHDVIYQSEILRSTDEGDHWQNILTTNRVNLLSITTAPNGEIFVPNGSNGNGYTGGYYHSMNNGASWEHVSVYDNIIKSEQGIQQVEMTSDGTLYAHNYYLYRSTDNGANWTQLNDQFSILDDLGTIFTSPNGEIYVGSSSGAVRSIDNGMTWSLLNSGLQNDLYASSFALSSDGFLLRGSGAHGVVRSHDPLTGINPRTHADNLHVPARFELIQNYPNPFNPTTTIEFQLASDALVTMKVYNTVGQEVATLADHKQFGEGSYDLEFDGSGLSSGLYYYRITAQDLEGGQTVYTSVRKMMLIK